MRRPCALLFFPVLLAGSTLAAAAGPTAVDRTTSPNGRWQTEIHPEAGEAAANGDQPTSLWLVDTQTGARRLLLHGNSSTDPRRDLVSVHAPRFSLDGGYVYVEASAYATSPTVHQVEVRSGRERFIADGTLLGVLRAGPWRGFLMVQQHRYRSGGGSYEANIVIRPDGKRIASIPGEGDEAARIWLAAKGWRIS
jgi:hypothetical protein